MDYTLENIAAICGGGLLGKDSRVDGVMTDSRHSYGRDEHPLFVAIQGQNHDGHLFIGDLYRRGVRAFLIERDVDVTAWPDAGFIRVPGALRALQALAADYRGTFRGTVVGITGSDGKTTVKEWIAQLAPDGMKIFRSPRSYNSQLGVPLSVLMMRGDEDMAVIEAGISRPGEMERLAAIIRPDIGIFTTLGDEHGENFGSREEKAAEKIKLFETCGNIIYSGAYPAVGRLIAEKIPAAKRTDASEYLGLIPDTGDAAVRENAALVTAFYDAVGVPPGKIIPRLAGTQPATARLDIREGLGGSLVVSDPGNTDVNSLAIALDYLRKVSGGRPRMLVLSDILYSSLSDTELYGKVAGLVRDAGVRYFTGIGERIGRHKDLFGPDAEFYPAAGDFLKRLGQGKAAGRAILVKGNRSADFHRITHALERRSHTTVLEINLDAMIHNLNRFRSMLRPETRIMAMVKASGYGNGNYEVANMLYNQGVDYLAVAFADEGVHLREQGITMPIVVLNADSDSFGLMVANRLEPEIYSFASLRTFVSAVRDGSESNYPIHIKIDTGMHRLGFEEKDVPALTGILLKERPTVVVRSIFSHMAAADMPSEDDFTDEQIRDFDRISYSILEGLPYKPLRHIANSAGIERFPGAQFDMCRLGIGLYGISSAGNGLEPVSRLTTRIVQIKEVAASETVGYGRAGRLGSDTRLATIPVGYADGLDRHLGEGRWSVMVGDGKAPIVGRVCMDSCMVDITGIPGVREGDEVTVFGPVPGNTVHDMALVLGTIPYEIMTSVSERVKRIYIKE